MKPNTVKFASGGAFNGILRPALRGRLQRAQPRARGGFIQAFHRAFFVTWRIPHRIPRCGAVRF